MKDFYSSTTYLPIRPQITRNFGYDGLELHHIDGDGELIRGVRYISVAKDDLEKFIDYLIEIMLDLKFKE